MSHIQFDPQSVIDLITWRFGLDPLSVRAGSAITNNMALALDFALGSLGPKGVLVMKVFQGAGFQELLAQARKAFREVRMRKPKASRQRSSETYLVARDPRPV